MKRVRAASFPRDITYKGEGRGEEKGGGKKTRLKLGIYLRSQRNVVQRQFHRTEGGIDQKASLALLNFFGGSLGWEGKPQKLSSGF